MTNRTARAMALGTMAALQVRIFFVTIMCFCLPTWSGCSYLFVSGPPDNHTQVESFDCTTGNAWPVFDAVYGTINTVSAAAVASKGGPNQEAAKAGAFGSAILWGSSSIVGFSKTSRCREAKALADACRQRRELSLQQQQQQLWFQQRQLQQLQQQLLQQQQTFQRRDSAANPVVPRDSSSAPAISMTRDWARPGATPAGRYVVTAGGTVNGTVQDTKTGLIWQQTVPSGTYTWADATAYCGSTVVSKSLGGTGWRLPTIEELQTLVDHTQAAPPLIDSTALPPTPPPPFWSSSPGAGSSSLAWIVSFNDGDTKYIAVSYPEHVRCVR